MRKIGLTIAAAAAVLTSFVAPANAGCKSVTKIFESGSRTVTQKIKVCDNSGSEANDSQGGKGSASQGKRFAERQRLRFPRERFAEQQTGYHLAPTGPGPANLCPTGLYGAGALDALRCGAGLEGSRGLAGTEPLVGNAANASGGMRSAAPRCDDPYALLRAGVCIALATSRVQAMKRSTAGLRVRSFSVAIKTGRRDIGSSSGSSFNA